MVRKKIVNISAGLVFGICLLVMASCGPVNMFTNIAHVPSEYAMNYCGEGIKAPSRSNWFNRDPWIVFSDKNDNLSYYSITGKNEFKQFQFMTPFLVVRRNGDWLRVIKYSPEIVKNGKLKNRKKAEYYGWIHKSDLLLTRSGSTDMATGLKNKMITVIADTAALEDTKAFFRGDSVCVFKDLDLTKINSKVKLYNIVYPLKKSEDGRKTLVAQKPYISPDSLSTEVYGWIDNSLVSGIGQQLHVDIETLPAGIPSFKDRNNKNTLQFHKERLQSKKELRNIGKVLEYSPVVSYSQTDSMVRFRTGAYLPLIDKRDNYVMNVNGNSVTFGRFKQIEKNLEKINVMFVLEGNKEVIRQFPSIVNVVQGLQPMFTDSLGKLNYKFGAVLAFNEKGNSEESVLNLTDDYMELLDALSAKSKNIDNLSGKANGNWNALRRAVDLLKDQKEATNMIVLVGETGNTNEQADATLVNRLAEYNCRVLGFQLHGGNQDNFNNFVLQVESMINNYAARISELKRDKIVYASQLRKENEFIEAGRNSYRLDFPNRSMTQGWVVFPQKKENLSLEMLASSVDTLMQQIKMDNLDLTQNLYKAFEETGNYRNKFDTTFVDYHIVNKISVKSIGQEFAKIVPEYFIPSQPVAFSDSISPYINYHLLLSEAEYKSLRRFMNALSENMIDYKDEKHKTEKKYNYTLCGCPDDEWILKEPKVIEQKTPVAKHKYASTRKVRSNIRKIYYDYIKNDKLTNLNQVVIDNYTLAEAQRLITTCPTSNPVLKAFTLKNLLDKKKLTDETLDMLVDYFKNKKTMLEKTSKHPFTSNGQIYYWIDQKLLP